MSVNVCPPVPTVMHATPDSYNAIAGTIVTYSCDEGYAFSDGTFQVSAFCNGENWSVVPTTCLGTFIYGWIIFYMREFTYCLVFH
jgi:Sushi repeat (SCR repeat)